MSKTSLYQFVFNQSAAQFSLYDGTALTLQWADLPADLMLQLAAHGLKQKVADGAALSRDPETGRPATDADKITRMTAIFARIAAGQWSANREGGGGNVGGLLLRALIELYPHRTREQLVDFLAGKTAKDKAALRANPKIAAIIERIKAESAAINLDTDSILGELEG